MRGLATLGAMVAVLAGEGLVRADWEVRRHDRSALVEQAARALAERPDEGQLARRLITLTDPVARDRLRARFRERATAPAARYPAIAAYAQLLLALRRFDEAAVQFARALEVQPTALAALEGRARALTGAGRRADALSSYDLALSAARSVPERRRLLEAQLTVLEGQENVERELAIRRSLASLDPRDLAAAERLADALERSGRPAEAAAILESHVPTGQQARYLDLALRAAKLRDAGGDAAGAARALTEVLRRLPAGAADRRREAWAVAVEVARHQNALPALAGELARAPGPIEWEVLSQVRDELGDLDGALQAAQRAQEREGQNLDLARRVVALLERLGRNEEATAAYEALARMAPREPRWAVELVEREFRRGRRKIAEEHFDRAATRFANNAAGLAQLAELASRWGEDRRALAAWERVRRLDPANELAILGLGEVQFQRGKKEAALRTWQGLRERERVPAAGHLRLGEILLEHDLTIEAMAEVQRAQALEPKRPRPYRLMAQIFERQRKLIDAVQAWETVLALSDGPGHLSDRHEARARILALLARQGRNVLQGRIRRLEEEVRARPEDRETALFLAEAQQREGTVLGAIATLRKVVERDAALPAAPVAADGAPTRAVSDGGAPADAVPEQRGDDARADAVLALVRLLRHTGQVDEAIKRLEDLAQRAPTRAREALVQIADIELGRYDETNALVHAQRAARLGAGDGQALTRIAEIEERAGDDERALVTYRQAFARDGNPAAAFALARLLERRGQASDAADMLRQVLRTASDDEVVAEAGRRAIEVEEYLGRLADLERQVAGAIFSGQKGSTYRRVLVDILRRLLPALYRAPASDEAAAEARARIAQHGLRPLLELVTDGDADPDRSLVELLGILGNKDATPVLARLADTPPPPDRARLGGAAGAGDAQLVAVIALGRLADERGYEAVDKLASSPDATLRAAAVWALGRIGGPRSSAALIRSLQDPRVDVAALACLGIGRLREARSVALLAELASNAARPLRLRRAAVAGLALTGDRAATPTLAALVESGDDELERTAAVALGFLRDPRALPALLERALIPRRAPPPGGGAALLALDAWGAAGAPPDEARAIEGARLDTEALISALLPAPAPTSDRTALWLDRRAELQQALGGALDRGGSARRYALASLDARNDGPGLFPLVPAGEAPIAPAVAAALQELATGLRDRIVALADASEPSTQAAALRLLAKLGDPSLTPGRIAAVAASAHHEVRDVTALLARSEARRKPDAVAALVKALAAVAEGTPTWDTRAAAVAALAELGPAGTGALGAALADESPLVRAAAAGALVRVESATPALVGAADDPVASVRAAVARALQGRRAPAARRALDRLASDEVARVREAASSDDGSTARP